MLWHYVPLFCYCHESGRKQASPHLPANIITYLSDIKAFKKKNIENRTQSQTCLNFAEVHHVLREPKNPASLENRKRNDSTHKPTSN